MVHYAYKYLLYFLELSIIQSGFSEESESKDIGQEMMEDLVQTHAPSPRIKKWAFRSKLYPLILIRQSRKE